MDYQQNADLDSLQEQPEIDMAPPPSGSAKPEPELAEPPRAWMVAFGSIGLITVIGKSQGEVVHKLNCMRDVTGNDLMPIEVLNLQGEARTIYVDPALVEGVLEEFNPLMQSEIEKLRRRLHERSEVEVTVDEGSADD